MAIDQTKVALARKTGLAYVCAMCERYWRAAEHGAKCCEVGLNGNQCGGPLAGMTFPQYQGPLKEANWSSFCFRCGEPSVAGIQVNGRGKMLGLCEKHIHTIERLQCRETGKSPVVEYRGAGNLLDNDPRT